MYYKTQRHINQIGGNLDAQRTPRKSRASQKMRSNTVSKVGTITPLKSIVYSNPKRMEQPKRVNATAKEKKSQVSPASNCTHFHIAHGA